MFSLACTASRPFALATHLNQLATVCVLEDHAKPGLYPLPAAECNLSRQNTKAARSGPLTLSEVAFTRDQVPPD